MKTKVYLYKAKNREWRWRIKRAGRIVAESGEGYKRKAGAKKSLDALLTSIRRGNYQLA